MPLIKSQAEANMMLLVQVADPGKFAKACREGKIVGLPRTLVVSPEHGPQKPLIYCYALPHTGQYHSERSFSEFSIKVVPFDRICAGDGGYIVLKQHPVRELPNWLRPLVFLNPVEELNKKHAVIMLGGKCCILNEVTDAGGRKDVTFSSLSDFRNFYGNKNAIVPNLGKVPISKLWLESPHRREYNGLVFDPSNNSPNSHFNLYKGLAVEPKKGDWSLFRNHIFRIIADGDAEVFKWVMAWLARIVKDPGGERPGTCIVLRGPQGTGKGIFAVNFGVLFGQHFHHIRHPKHLIGRFNSHFKNCLVAFIDEGFWAGDKQAEGILKGMITEPTFLCEAKGVDAFEVANHTNFIMASNNDWVVPAGLEERRFCVLDVSDKAMRDYQYFKAIQDQMKNGGREAMLYDLLQIEISGINLRWTPQTKALLEQKIQSMKSSEKFWFECLKEGRILSLTEEWPPHVETQEMYGEYAGFCSTIGVKHKEASSLFTKSLKRLCPGITPTRRRLGDTHEKDNRMKVLLLPNLQVCRRSFEKVVGMVMDWEDDEGGGAEDSAGGDI